MDYECEQIFFPSVNKYSSQVWTNIHYECEQIQMSLDRLELSVDGGRVKIFIQIGHYDKTLIIGQVNMIMDILIMGMSLSFFKE